ncbi:MAG TPA: M1 family peptidase, partial [Spirochaetia bacterium]|nr:M1 family peptidase [Spirochaetia bacterium]
MEEKTSVSHRLDRTVIPVRYELRIVPDLDAGRFEGSEEILIEVENPVPAIVLNSAELSIGACWIASPSGGQIAAASTEIDEPNERIHLELKGGLAPGSYLLHVDFAGTLNDKLRGFYRIHHKDAAGNPLTIGATQFEATDARRAFPCFDEPDMKAVFSITLEVETGMLAVSNTP